MSNPLTDARLALVALLEPLGWRVYPNAVENPVPPCIQIYPGPGEWLINPRLGGNKRDMRVSLRLSAARVSGNAEGLAMLEEMVWAVTQVVAEREVIGVPKLDTSGPTECYVVDVTILATGVG